MGRSRKLRGYTRKDYSNVVDFPVEIVGRDGLVRRYSFEESVLLYQRRIASARDRYADGDVVRAEVQHCEQRIRQLRNSYFSHFGWSAARVVDSPGMAAGDFAGEVVAFLRRVVSDDTADAEGLELAFVADEEHRQLYFVRHRGEEETSRRSLLYLYRFGGDGAPSAREAFFRFLRVLEDCRHGGADVEHVAGFHHSADCGLVLTASGPGSSRYDILAEGVWADGVHPPASSEWMELVDVRDDPLRQGMLLLRRGERRAALASFNAAYEQNHYRRSAYIGAMVVADQLGAHDDAATAALMATRYFPADAVMHYHLAVARVRTGVADATDAAARVRELEGDGFVAEFLDALVALRAGRTDTGRRHIQRASGLAGEADSDLLDALRVVRGHLAGRDLMRLCGAALIAAGLVLALSGTLSAIGLSVAGAALIPGADALWRHRLSTLLGQPGTTGIRLANPASLRIARR